MNMDTFWRERLEVMNYENYSVKLESKIFFITNEFFK